VPTPNLISWADTGVRPYTCLFLRWEWNWDKFGIMKKMQAVVFKKHGDVDKLQVAEVPIPRLGPRDVLVKVQACAVNHLDLWNLFGLPVPIEMPHILGCDVSGEVVEKGKRVRGVPLHRPVIAAPGIRCGRCHFCKTGWDSLCDHYNILGFQRNGGYAEYVKVPQENIIPVSSRLSMEEWAAVPLVFLTAWHMLITRAGLKKKETVLIHAAGSGIGSAAIQIAKCLGARVITTVGKEWKVRHAKALGADHVILYQKRDFLKEVKRLTKGQGVDVVFEHLGSKALVKSLHCLVKKGRLVTCGATTGPTVTLDIRTLFMRQISMAGCYMGGLGELRKVIRLIETRKLKSVVDKTFPLHQARQALQRMKSRKNFGKILLVP